MLWIPGMAILLLVGGWSVGSSLPISQKNLVWLLYAVIGVFFPITVLLLSLPGSASTKANPTSAKVFAALSIFFIFYSTIFFGIQLRDPIVFLPVALEMLIILGIVARRREQSLLSIVRSDAPRVAVILAFLTLCWRTSMYLAWRGDFVHIVSSSGYAFLVFLSTMFCCTAWVFCPPVENGILDRVPVKLAIHCAAVLLFGIASLRTFISDGFGATFDLTNEIHCWAVYVSPAQMVRHGAFMLWDVPSQYGFLSILLPAILPIRSAWESFYLCFALSQLLTAVFLYWLLASRSSSALGFAFSALLVMAVVFLKPWSYLGIIGSQIVPSQTAYRFGGAYALFAVAYISSFPNSNRRPWYFFTGIGTLIWLFNCFWSSETAAWCTIIWLPTLAHLLYRQWCKEVMQEVPKSIRARRLGFMALLPLGALLLVVGAIDAYYIFRLGHGPDWSCYIGYLRAAGSGAFIHEFSLGDAATTYFLVPVLVLIGLVIAASHVIKRSIAAPELTVLVAAFTLVWSLDSYSIAELYPLTVEECGEIFCLIGIVAIFHVLRQAGIKEWWSLAIKACSVPLLALPILIAFQQWPIIAMWSSYTFVRHPMPVDRELPSIDDSLGQLLQQAGVKQSDPIVLLDEEIMPVWLQNNPGYYQGISPALLPVTPGALVGPLSPSRMKVYIDRYADRRKAGGWLIERKHVSKDHPDFRPIVLPLIQDRFEVEKSYSNADYSVLYMIYRPKSSSL